MVTIANIYLIRHGEKSEDGKSLTGTGKKQINYLAKRLFKIGIDKIYSSNISRCIESAKILSGVLGKKVVYDQSLREVGPKVFNSPRKYVDETTKVKKFADKIRKMKGNVLVVGSGNVNRIIIANLMGIDQKKLRLIQIPSCVNQIRVSDSGRISIFSLDDTRHLPENLVRRQNY